ncbi:PEP-CTERM sorting domain-containing protein [Thiohalorhabdus sp.]|uniref:PEP-CTERM sorting domain-containing protein n=1 Tax=Thiohalorhabdus sp. TaxID=3094134 RepID=UPI003FCCC2D8
MKVEGVGRLDLTLDRVAAGNQTHPSVPVPGTLALIGAGLIGLGAIGARRRYLLAFPLPGSGPAGSDPRALLCAFR